MEFVNKQNSFSSSNLICSFVSCWDVIAKMLNQPMCPNNTVITNEEAESHDISIIPVGFC